MQLSYEFLKPEVQPVYAKDAKDSKGMGKEVAGVENSSIWQRMLWNTKVTHRGEQRLRSLSANGVGCVQRQLRHLQLLHS